MRLHQLHDGIRNRNEVVRLVVFPLPESDPEYDEMQDLLKKAQDLAANATYAPGACTEDNNRQNAKRSRDA